ncbi:uncharacterized protein Gasu_26610 [Galdieria sulphuraria]|uniref:Secreted protein n=1 Tax=Galdieria sulphuraria TaxID=130081 RepID=M2Y2N3_GALSU|nr:uncharacterized protein Gasu_26610 [Galdieria sulphuraria]EME30079.1 hypothetical protein Gasu_26610 [Galdieria sulphuraria]|eukprot:XP_005706599.1 hypothetical protein Gasu_26610 [Galdieria sulphuraria]
MLHFLVKYFASFFELFAYFAIFKLKEQNCEEQTSGQQFFSTHKTTLFLRLVHSYTLGYGAYAPGRQLLAAVPLV